MFQRKARFASVAFVRGPLPLLGPAFVAAIAYIDPGNFATNITAGSRFGYLLVWVIVVSNLMAMLIQYLSAKAGIATGKNLPELCRDNFPRPVTRGLWVQAELVAIATDLAEVLGGAIALQLLFGLPLLAGGLITAAVAFALLGLQSRGARPFEVAITGLLLVVLVGFLYSLIAGGVDAGGAAAGLTPSFEGTDTLLLATGMLGATVMPHVIYLHGALTQSRFVRTTEQERLALLHHQRIDVVSAMTVAGVINLSMLVVAAQVLSRRSCSGGHDRGGARRPGDRAGPDGRSPVRTGTARVGVRRLGGRHLLRPGGDAGLPATADSSGPATSS